MGKRGQKICPECSSPTGPRSFNCPECGYEYQIKKGGSGPNKGRNGKEIDWRDLEPEDIIKVVSGSGPYWEGKEGRVPMGYHGLYRVKHIYNNGLLCYPAENRQGEASFIYMGDDKPSKIGGMLRSHKVRKVDDKYVRK